MANVYDISLILFEEQRPLWDLPNKKGVASLWRKGIQFSKGSLQVHFARSKSGFPFTNCHCAVHYSPPPMNCGQHEWDCVTWSWTQAVIHPKVHVLPWQQCYAVSGQQMLGVDHNITVSADHVKQYLTPVLSSFMRDCPIRFLCLPKGLGWGYQCPSFWELLQMNWWAIYLLCQRRGGGVGLTIACSECMAWQRCGL